MTDPGIITNGGSIHCILGPMFSGKSDYLLREIRRYTIAKKRCLVIKYAKDTRYNANDQLCTHDLTKTPAVSVWTLEDTKLNAHGYDVIAIDEGQFFTDILTFSEEMANKGKIVVIAALDGTFERKPFNHILDLIPLAESVIKLTAICMMCCKEAAFSRRLGNEKTVELIGGSEKYMAVCRTCYFASQNNLPLSSSCNISEDAVLSH